MSWPTCDLSGKLRGGRVLKQQPFCVQFQKHLHSEHFEFCLSLFSSFKSLFSSLSSACYSPALRGVRGFDLPSWVLRFLPFRISCKCFHFLLLGLTTGSSGEGFTASLSLAALPGSPFSTVLGACFRAQTCSQIWSTVLRLGWSTSCMKSRYHSFWLVEGLALRGSSREGGSEEVGGDDDDVDGTTSRVMPSRVWVKPCSMAWHW